MTSRSDNFNRTDTASGIGTPSDGGSGWVQTSGTWGITTNRGYKSASDGAYQVCDLEASSYQVDVQATLASRGAGSVGGVVARLADNNNYIMAFCGDSFILFKKVAGSFTQIGSTYSAGSATNDVVKLTANASNNLEVFVNGVSRITGTDAAGATNTRHGLMVHTNTFYFDDFSITDNAGGGGGATPKGWFGKALHGPMRRVVT